MAAEQSQRVLFRMFYLEDDQFLNDDVRAILPHYLPGLAIDWAGTIESGLSLLAEGRDYDLGLLDVRVPRTDGAFPEAHDEVAQALREKDVALIIYSAYLETNDVKEFLTRKLVDPPLKVISKLEVDPIEEISVEAHGWFMKLASSRMSDRIRKVFQVSSESEISFRGTGALMSLQHDIRDYWLYLNESTKDAIKTRFDVQETDGKLTRLSLMPYGG